MDNIVDVYKRLPKWAQIAVPIALAAVVYFIYRGKSSSSSGTSTEETVGTDTVGTAATSADTTSDSSTGSTTSTSSSTTTPAVHKPAMANAKEIALANHWLAQEHKNERSAGLKQTGGKGANANMTSAQVMAMYHTNKGGATVAAKQIGKTRSVDGSHVVKSKKESPKAARVA